DARHLAECDRLRAARRRVGPRARRRGGRHRVGDGPGGGGRPRRAAAGEGGLVTERLTPPAGIDPMDLVDGSRFAARGYPHAVWAQLRAEAPVCWFEPEGWTPFWAVTRHADIQFVAKQPDRWSNEH